MPQYLVFFNQQWVGDHTPEWFSSRGPLARAVVEEMSADEAAVFWAGKVAQACGWPQEVRRFTP